MATYGQTVRRGLPRRPGGDPWPADGMSPVVEHDGTPASAVESAAQDEAPAAPAVRETVMAAAVAPPTAVAEPPTVAAPAAATLPASTGAPRIRRGLPRVAGGEPWPPDRVAPVASVALADRAPLPFTRTVWPGASAKARPKPTPAPKLIGPFTKLQWAGAAVVGGFGLLFAAGMAVLFTRWFLSLEFMEGFIATYPGEYHLPEGAPVGIPPWLGWQHFFNVFLMVLIIRSGLTIRNEKRPSVFWSPKSNGRRKMSLTMWFHQALDLLWIVNGVVFVILLFVTGQWMKIVPTSWTVFPNAISAGLQYVSLDWPTENGWVNYNSLQQLAYFTTVFLAAPLAIITGARMSWVWPKQAKTLNKLVDLEWARKLHFPVMLYFVLFIFVHVALVFATGALRNLNHMYASQDAVNWTGFWIFAASLVVIAAAWVAARPLVIAPIARLFGTVTAR